MNYKLNQIKKLWVGMAEFYRVSLTDNQLAMYAEDLLDLDLSKIYEGMIRCRRQNSQFLPMPGAIRQEILGQDKDEAIAVADKLIEGLSKDGWNNPERFRKRVGEVGWKIVEQHGGLENFSRESQEVELSIFRSQIRESARVFLVRTKAGRSEAPQLPVRETLRIENKS